MRTNPLIDERRSLERRLDTVGWGLLCLLLAALAMPSGELQYASVAAAGGLLVLLNVGRAVVHVDVAWFGLVLGVTALTAGAAAMAGVRLDAFALFFAILGVVFIGAAVRSGPRSSESGEQPA